MGALAQQTTGSGLSIPELAWANVEPYNHLGELEVTSTYRSAEVPVEVINAAAKILAGQPVTWQVNHIMNYARQGKEVLVLNDTSLRAFICLIKPDQWLRLNDPRSLPAMNEVMG